VRYWAYKWHTAVILISLVIPTAVSTGTPLLEGEDEMLLPRLELSESVHDFGKLRPQEVVKCTVLIRNVGGDTLTISNVHSSCGCTVAKLDKSELAPGNETEFHIKFTASSRPGATEKHITFRTNDPDFGTAKIQLRAEVVPRIIVDPATVQFGRVPIGEEKELTLEIRPGENEPLWNSLRLVSSVSHVTVEPLAFQGDVAADTVSAYTITLTPAAPVGRTRSYVNVFVNDETKPAARVSVIASIQGRIRVNPPSAHLTARVGSPSPSRDVVLSHLTEQPFDIVEVTCDIPQISWDIDQTQGKAQYTMHVRLKDNAPVGRMLRGKLIVTTNDSLQPTVTIPVFAQRSAPRPGPSLPGPVKRTEAAPPSGSSIRSKPARTGMEG